MIIYKIQTNGESYRVVRCYFGLFCFVLFFKFEHGRYLECDSDSWSLNGIVHQFSTEEYALKALQDITWRNVGTIKK